MRDPYALSPDEMMTPARAPAVPELPQVTTIPHTRPLPMQSYPANRPGPDAAVTPPLKGKTQFPAMAEVEARAGVASIEELQAERAHLVQLNSRVKALKDSTLWKELRDIELAKAAARVRASVPAEAKAPSEAFVESNAKADPAYVQWVEQLAANFSAYELVEERITEINELVNRGQALLRYLSSEPKA